MLTTPREWLDVEVDKPTGENGAMQTWAYRFDITFLASTYGCMYGQDHQCPGGWGSTQPGCCATGPVVDEDDIANVTEMVKSLLPDKVDNYEQIVSIPSSWKTGNGWYKQSGDLEKDGGLQHRVVDGNCVFLNTGKKPNAPHGCSLHRRALELDIDVLDSKPGICWQVPLLVDLTEDDTVTIITSWDRDENGGWNDPDGWWCVEDHIAYRNSEPLYVTMSHELIRLVGQQAYDELVICMATREHLGMKMQSRSTPVAFRKTKEAVE
jgi:hypothetical protein